MVAACNPQLLYSRVLLSISIVPLGKQDKTGRARLKSCTEWRRAVDEKRVEQSIRSTFCHHRHEGNRHDGRRKWTTMAALQNRMSSSLSVRCDPLLVSDIKQTGNNPSSASHSFLHCFLLHFSFPSNLLVLVSDFTPDFVLQLTWPFERTKAFDGSRGPV